MIYILTILYSVFLGSIFRNFFSPKYEPSPNESVTMQILIVKDKAPLIISILLLFLIDWISFLFIYEPHSKFTLEVQDIILTVFYIPTVTFLTFALILALDTTKEKYCLFFGLYHILSSIAEITWIIFTINKLNFIDKSDTVSIMLISFIYVFLRLAWAIYFLFRHSKPNGFLNPTLLTFFSCVFKPLLIIYLHLGTNFSSLITQHQ